jgi:hypothetical protein
MDGDPRQIDLEEFLRRGQAAQASVDAIIQKSDREARRRPRARGTDPQTSHAAAKRAANELTHKQQAVLEVFMLRFRESGGHDASFTDPRMIREYNLRRHTMNWPAQSESGLRTRRHELVVKEKLEKVGIKDGKHTIWRIKRGES